MALILIESLINGTGFNGYYAISTTHTISGPPHTITSIETYQPGKTLWDWMQLLFIPVVLAVAGFWFNHRERKAAELRAEADRGIEQQRAKAEQQIASDNQREAALQKYIDDISELLLQEKLCKSEPESEARKIARVRTLTVLLGLDRMRKRSVLQFLYEARLIDKNNPIVDLQGADFTDVFMHNFDLHGAMLSKVNLSGSRLKGANLSETDLSDASLGINYRVLAFDGNGEPINIDSAQTYLIEANLSGAVLRNADLNAAWLHRANLSQADLDRANLSGAILSGANLTGAKVSSKQLDQAKSLKGATMPDGSIHP